VTLIGGGGRDPGIPDSAAPPALDGQAGHAHGGSLAAAGAHAGGFLGLAEDLKRFRPTPGRVKRDPSRKVGRTFSGAVVGSWAPNGSPELLWHAADGRGGVPGPYLGVLAGAVPTPCHPRGAARPRQKDGRCTRVHAAGVPGVGGTWARWHAWPGGAAGAAVPRPTEAGRRYVPALDGVRALAVLLVLAYHLRLPMVPGGLLGVGIFFTLSGYLITDLLLAQWDARGRVRLGDFWIHRARRLLPAVFVVLVAVAAWILLFDRSRLSSVGGEIAAACGYVSNWWVIAQHGSYFSRFAPPSPLGHLWSLAIEEQFYLIWPWVLLLGVRVVRSRYRLAGLTLVAAAASAVAMALLYTPGVDPTRVYQGTDTRAFGLLIGAAAAMIAPTRRLRRPLTPTAQNLLDATGVAGLVVIGVLVYTTTEYSAFLFRGGLVMLSVATAAVVVAVSHPHSRLAWVLSGRLLQWIGVRSYGIYLWHVPVIVLTTPITIERASAPVAVAQVAATFGLAALSWRYVEDPIRGGALGRLWTQLRRHEWRLSVVPARAWMASTGVLAGVVVLAVAASGAAARPARAGVSSAPPISVSFTGTPSEGSSRLPQPGATLSSCRAVVHIGDSTSEGLISPAYLSNPSQRVEAQYARVGATTQRFEISGARSIVETLPGQINAADLARQLVAQGFSGCWVLALGDNDTANVHAGSIVPLSPRIDRMMSIIGSQPVLWVNAKTLLGSGDYSDANMQLWNQALVEACPRYPNMRIYDWHSVVQDSWFTTDDVHYTSSGYAQRARLFADALADAFPARGHGPRCLVR